MEAPSQIDPEKLLLEARGGDRESLGTLLEPYRTYLRLIAGAQIDYRLRARVNASDVVQETFLQASKHFKDFRGGSEQEWLCWLRTILRRCLLRMVQKQVLTRKRAMGREVPIRQENPSSPVAFGVTDASLVSRGSSPSSNAAKQELAAVMAERLSRLPASYRDVLVLRNLEGLPFAEVARLMGRTPGAVRVLWLRALERLRQEPFSEDLL